MWMLSLLFACTLVDYGPPYKDCDAMAYASVNVTLSTADDVPVEGAEVFWSVDGGAEQPCESFGDAGSWACGWEVAGDITVRADALGYGEASETVWVEQGECHVVPVALDLVMEPVDCTEEVVTSVIVTVEDAEGQRLPEAEVAFAPVDELWANPEPCAAMDDAQFACGAEHAGVLGIWVDAEGFVSEYTEVDVTADECHVITREVTVTMTPA